MPFLCPECTAKSLVIVLTLELPPDSHWDEIALQTLSCTQCTFAGLAVYQESRRGALDAEIVHHEGYRITRADWQRVERAIKRCPTPNDRRCECFAHRAFGRTEASGRWTGLETIARAGLFTLER